METSIQKGYLVLADLSGYTSFLAESELDHAPNVLRFIFSHLIENLTPTLTLAEVEGDALFLYAPIDRLSRGELLLELEEAGYVAFRDAQRTMLHNATCPCNACRSIGSLDLKFVNHFGDYVLQEVAGTSKPLGSSVNLVHRLLKNNVQAETGWQGYALFSTDCLDQMDICPSDAHEGAEAYEHLGTVLTRSIDLHARYHELIAERRVLLTSEEADVVIDYDFEAPVPIVWDWLSDPVKRNQWVQGANWNVEERPGGRTAPKARNHCANSDFIEFVLDWRPFRYYTVTYSRGVIRFIITGHLEAASQGAHLQWRMQLEGSLPRWVLRPLARLLVHRVMQVERDFGRMAQLMGSYAVPVVTLPPQPDAHVH